MDAICAASKLLLVREDADDVGGPFDLFIEVFQRIGRVDLTPMAWWKALPHEHVDLGLGHQIGKLGMAVLEDFDQN